MEHQRNGRHGVHASMKQKKKLIGFMARHPELISAKVTTSFSYADRHRLWKAISDECNALPGAKKDWRQWRKTWQDLRSKYKKQYSGRDEDYLPPHIAQLSNEERDVLGLDTTLAELKAPKIVPHSEDRLQSLNTQEDNSDYEITPTTYSEPESPPEQKVFTRSKSKLKNRSQKEHSDNCPFNCDLLAVQEQRRLDMKQDYINFKKNYLQQKLKFIKEQTEALKTIARELSDE